MKKDIEVQFFDVMTDPERIKVCEENGSFNKTVGGSLEVVNLKMYVLQYLNVPMTMTQDVANRISDKLTIVCNGDGQLRNLPFNTFCIRGKFFIGAMYSNGFRSLTNNQSADVLDLFAAYMWQQKAWHEAYNNMIGRYRAS